jgi:chromosome segregation ATPase
MVHEQNPDCVQAITELKASTKSAHKRLDNISELIDLVHGMNTNIATIALETKHQGEQLKKIVETMEKQGEKIDNIEDKMETKETVSKLVERLERVENKSGTDAEKMLKQVKWLLISLSITAVFGLVWLAITKGG